MFLPPTPASPGLGPAPLTPPLPGIAPAPPTQQPLPGLAEVLDLLQMSEELETISAFCEEHDITHIAKWAGPARFERGLCVDKYTELREIISARSSTVLVPCSRILPFIGTTTTGSSL